MKKRNYRRAIQALCILIIAFIFAGVMVTLAVITTYAQSEAVVTDLPQDAKHFHSETVHYYRDRPELDISDMAELSEPISEPNEPSLCGEELYRSYVDEIAASYFPNLDPAMVKALIYTESRYQPDVSSSAGAVGLMQVIPYYHAWRIEKYGMSDIWDPYTNILVGMDLLDELYQKYGNWYDVLYFYSGGDASYPGLIASRSAQYK